MTLLKPQDQVANFSADLGEPHEYAEHNGVQNTLDNHAASGSEYDMTTVALSPQEGRYDTDDLDLPLTVPTGVHLDLNGMTLWIRDDIDVIRLQPGSGLTKGHINWSPAGEEYTSSVIKLDDSSWDRDATAEDPILVRDVWGRGQPRSSGKGIYVDLQNGYSVDGGLLVKHQRFFRVGGNHYRIEVGDRNSSFDNNVFKDCFNHSGHPILINFHSQVSGASINNNHISGVYHPSQYSNSDEDSDWLAKLHGYEVQGNNFYLKPMWDLHRFDDGLFWFDEEQPEGVINNHMYNTQQILVDERGWIDHAVEPWYDLTSHEQNGHTIWTDGTGGPGRGELYYGNFQNEQQ